MTETRCGRCGEEISEEEAETCWWCTGWLCYPCWDEHGHCGHPEADALEEYARAASQPGRLSRILDALRRLLRPLWADSAAIVCPERWAGGGWEPGACGRCPLKGECEQ